MFGDFFQVTGSTGQLTHSQPRGVGLAWQTMLISGEVDLAQIQGQVQRLQRGGFVVVAVPQHPQTEVNVRDDVNRAEGGGAQQLPRWCGMHACLYVFHAQMYTHTHTHTHYTRRMDTSNKHTRIRICAHTCIQIKWWEIGGFEGFLREVFLQKSQPKPP